MRKLITAGLLLITSCVSAQQNDTTAMLKQFLKVCTGYKQYPLQVDMEFQRSANISFEGDDTSTIQAKFYVNGKSAYVKFGELEQLIEDSLQLMIIPQIKQMVLTVVDSMQAEKFRRAFGFMPPDSSLQKAEAKFAVTAKTENNRGVINLIGRKKIYSTTLPFEEVKLTYNLQTNEPVKVELVRRSLVALPEGTKSEQQEQRYSVVTFPNAANFAVREEKPNTDTRKLHMIILPGSQFR